MIGGLSIPYAAIPMTKRIGITIGGTRYFIVFPLPGESNADALTERSAAGITTDRAGAAAARGKAEQRQRHENTA
jgi:hypothetical protein